MSETANVASGRKSQAQVLLEHVAAGITTTTELAKAMGVSKGRISHLTGQLLKKKKLAVQGRIYSLRTTRKFIADFAAPIASQPAPIKEEQGKTPLHTLNVKSKLDGQLFTKTRHAVQIRKKGDFDTLSREHWIPYTSPGTIAQETGVPPRLLIRSNAKELVDNALDWADRHGYPGAVTVNMEGDCSQRRARLGCNARRLCSILFVGPRQYLVQTLEITHPRRIGSGTSTDYWFSRFWRRPHHHQEL
jgi:hypothetical protein